MEHHTTAKATKGNAIFCLKTCAALVSLLAQPVQPTQPAQ